jgi:hypothetical protein
MFWPIHELGAVYALYQKWLIRWRKTWILAIFFVDSNLHWAICRIHYTMDHAKWQSGNAKMFSCIIMATCERKQN